MWMDVPGAPPTDSTHPTMIQCALMTETVDSVVGDVRVVRMVNDSVRLDMPGMPGTMPGTMQGMMRDMVVVMRRDSRGRVLSSEVRGPNVPASTMGGLSGTMGGLMSKNPGLPEPAVRLGETWIDSMPLDIGTEAVQSTGYARVVNRLDSLLTRGAARLAVVSATGLVHFDVEGGQMQMQGTASSEGDVTWDLTAGRMTRFRTTTTGTMRMPSVGMVMPFRMRMRLSLLDGAPEATTSCK